MVRGQWVQIKPKGSNAHFERDKPAIDAACERFIDDVLKPRFLPEICPTEFNYCIDIFGKWHGRSYRFIQRYRTDRPDADEREFDAPFTRLEYTGPDRFDLSYMRHTGQWNCIFRGLTLKQAFETIESQIHFHPL